MKFTSQMVCQSSVETSSRPKAPPIPALEQKISIPPIFSLAKEIKFLISSSFPTFRTKPENPNFSATFKTSSFKSARTISLAFSFLNSMARAFPIPLAAPVTTTLLSTMSMIKLRVLQ